MKTPPRRSLRFTTLEEVRAEADRLAAEERAGTLRTVGTWSLGQTFNHLASWIDFGFDGVPIKPPLIVRVLMRVLIGKKRFVNNPMRAGVRIPGMTGGTLAMEPIILAEAEPKFHAAIDRLIASTPSIPNALFGPMTHEEWLKLNLRHAELHLSYFQ